MQEFWESISVILIPPWKDSLAMTVWSVYGAIFAAWIYAAFRRATLGKALRALTDGGCYSAETAKSAEELGFSPKVIRPSDRLVESVAVEGKPCRYFLPEDRKAKAAGVLKGASSKPWQVILSLFVCYVLMVLSYYFAPGLFKLFDQLWAF